MNTIPTLPNPFDHSDDLRVQYLTEWKTLFSKIHPAIRVIHCYEETFQEELFNDTNSFNRVRFDMDIYNRARIIVFLPTELELSYIIGVTYDQMFSKREVMLDTLYHDEGFPCEPALCTWEEMYEKLCSLAEDVKKEIPPPPL